MSVGIKETKEFVVGINEIGLKLIKRFKDGVQFEDFTAFYEDFVGDADFRAKIQAAYDGKEKLVAEVTDLGFFEMIELGQIQLGYIPKFIQALKG